MSAVSTIVKNTFNKVFNSLAKELNVPVEKIQIGIFYVDGKQKFEVFNHFKRVSEFDFADHIPSVVDWSGGSAMIEATIAQGGARYSKELNTPIDAIKIIMAYKKDCLPDAVLMNAGKKERNVNIEEEFLQ